MYDCSYEVYMVNLIDELIVKQDQVIASGLDDYDHCQLSTSIGRQSDVTNQLFTKKKHNHQGMTLGIEAHFDHHDSRDEVNKDVCIPNKVIGFLNHQPAKFLFIGPDRAPVLVDSIQKCLDIANIIRQTKVPNYAQARITLKSGLNIDKWEQILQDYPD